MARTEKWLLLGKGAGGKGSFDKCMCEDPEDQLHPATTPAPHTSEPPYRETFTENRFQPVSGGIRLPTSII